MTSTEPVDMGPKQSLPGGRTADARSGLTFRIARSLEEVVEAWRLVYRRYRQAGLIEANSHELHVVSKAVGPRTLVVLGRSGGEVVSTLSSYVDGPEGLPLDSVYHAELNELREAGRALMEIGMFADRREQLARSMDSLFDLMRHVSYFGLHEGATDAVIGVHPRHAEFYCRLLGFEMIGEVKAYPTVKRNPVVLLQLDWHRKTRQEKLPRGLRYFLKYPLESGVFRERVILTEQLVKGSPIGALLADRAGPGFPACRPTPSVGVRRTAPVAR